MTNLTPLWSALSEVDQRAGSLATMLPLLSVSKSRGIIRYGELFPDRVIRADDLGHYKVVESGQIVLNKMSAATGAVGRANERGLVSPDYAVLSPSDDSDSRYLSYLLGSEGFCKNEVEPRLQGIGIGDVSNARTPRVTMTSYLSPVAFLPQVDTQRAIADYLDRETGEIDAMIAKMDELTETLEVRRRQAINVVLDQTSSRQPLWSLTSAIVDCPHTTPTLDRNGTAEAVRTASVRNGRFLPGNGIIVSSETASKRNGTYEPQVNDVFFTREAPAGEACLVPDGEFCLGQRMVLLRPDPNLLDSRFLVYAIYTQEMQDEFRLSAGGSTVVNLKLGTIRSTSIPEIPVWEQRRIADHLDEVTGKIDTMLAKVAELKSLLIERRAALITDVVTGRKAVA